MSQSLVEEPQIQRSLFCSRDFFSKKLPLTSGFQKKTGEAPGNDSITRDWWSDRCFGGTIQHNNDPRQCRNQRDSFFFYFVPAMRNMSNRNGTAGGQFSFLHLYFGPVVTLIQHVLAILICSTLRLSNELCTRYALNLNGSYRHITFYDKKVHGYHRNEVVF